MSAQLLALALNPSLDDAAFQRLSAQVLEGQRARWQHVTESMAEVRRKTQHLPPEQQAQILTTYATQVLTIMAMFG